MPSDGRPLTLHVTVPGGHDLSLEHLVLDVNGTLSARAEFRRVESGGTSERTSRRSARSVVWRSATAERQADAARRGSGLAVLGPEGLRADALSAADVIAISIDGALGLLSDVRALTATLRP
jgi:hypothetical protein